MSLLYDVYDGFQLCDGVGIARLLNATLVLPKFEVAAYWNESRQHPYFHFKKKPKNTKSFMIIKQCKKLNANVEEYEYYIMSYKVS